MKLSMIAVTALATVLQVFPFVSHAGCDDDRVAVTEGASLVPEKTAMALTDASEVPAPGADGESAY